jgi:hypothetical protein
MSENSESSDKSVLDVRKRSYNSFNDSYSYDYPNNLYSSHQDIYIKNYINCMNKSRQILTILSILLIIHTCFIVFAKEVSWIHASFLLCLLSLIISRYNFLKKFNVNVRYPYKIMIFTSIFFIINIILIFVVDNRQRIN